VLFNYLGRFDPADEDTALLVRAAESAGPLHGPRSHRTHLLEVNSAVSGDRLVVSFVHSTRVHDADTVQGLADRFLDRLRASIVHCAAPDAGGYTPSDFPLAALDQARLGRLAFYLGPRAVEDVYPLSPMQQGMLFHSIADPDAGTYVEQLRFTVDGLDAKLFHRAWTEVVARHPALRIAIIDPASAVPLQVVLREVSVPFSVLDCRELTDDEKKQRIERLCAHEERDFDLSAAPLMRLALARTHDRRYEFLWTFHHIVLDGWSFARVLNEVPGCAASRRACRTSGRTGTTWPGSGRATPTRRARTGAGPWAASPARRRSGRRDGASCRTAGRCATRPRCGVCRRPRRGPCRRSRAASR
jgi:non-ribosomal peptide synthase protein (TIGR01720 family)